MKAESKKIADIKFNPNNPRVIKDEKFRKLVQSIKDFPKMLSYDRLLLTKTIWCWVAI